jgi:hypothetical protein
MKCIDKYIGRAIIKIYKEVKKNYIICNKYEKKEVQTTKILRVQSKEQKGTKDRRYVFQIN